MKYNLCLLTLIFTTSLFFNLSSQAPLVYEIENTGVNCALPILPTNDEPEEIKTITIYPNPAKNIISN